MEAEREAKLIEAVTLLHGAIQQALAKCDEFILEIRKPPPATKPRTITSPWSGYVYTVGRETKLPPPPQPCEGRCLGVDCPHEPTFCTGCIEEMCETARGLEREKLREKVEATIAADLISRNITNVPGWITSREWLRQFAAKLLEEPK